MFGARLIPSSDGWWALFGQRVAHLPPEAVRASVVGTPRLDAADHHDQAAEVQLSPEAVDQLSAAGFFAPEAATTYAVTVLTATACNLGCGYCFQNTAQAPVGSFAPPRIETAALDRSTVAGVVRFVERQQKVSGRPHVSLLLFGGEPLLNLDACSGLLDGVRPLGLVDAEMVTNGVLLTPGVARGLHDSGLNRVQITFDGDRRAHDQIRVTRNGRPTFDAILRNVRAASQAAPSLGWNFRVNVSHRNIESLHDLVAELAPVAEVARRVTFHLALIDDVGLGYDNHVGYDTALAERFIDINDAAIASGMAVLPTATLTQCPYCGVVGGGSGAVVNADGTLFSCWENAGRPGWEVGTVEGGYAAHDIVSDRWVACDFDTQPHGDAQAAKAFMDRVDGAALDEQRRLETLRVVG